MVKGPDGMSFTALKLFTKENQQTILAFEAHIACILQDDQDLEIGQTPSLQNPEIVPRLKGKATIGTGSSIKMQQQQIIALQNAGPADQPPGTLQNAPEKEP